MSDKKDPEQTKPENKTSAISSNTNQQTDISTSIDISSTLLEPSNEESAKKYGWVFDDSYCTADHHGCH